MRRLNDRERELLVDNYEPLYLDRITKARTTKQYVRLYRKAIDEVIRGAFPGVYR